MIIQIKIHIWNGQLGRICNGVIAGICNGKVIKGWLILFSHIIHEIMASYSLRQKFYITFCRITKNNWPIFINIEILTKLYWSDVFPTKIITLLSSQLYLLSHSVNSWEFSILVVIFILDTNIRITLKRFYECLCIVFEIFQ